jgi:hypothetical protein
MKKFANGKHVYPLKKFHRGIHSKGHLWTGKIVAALTIQFSGRTNSLTDFNCFLKMIEQRCCRTFDPHGKEYSFKSHRVDLAMKPIYRGGPMIKAIWWFAVFALLVAPALLGFRYVQTLK